METSKGSGIPKHWVETNIGSIVLYRKGKKPSTLITEKKEGYLPYILIDELEGNKPRNYTNEMNLPIATKEDVLLVWDGSIGKCSSGIEGVIGSTLVALTPLGKIPTKFIEYIIINANRYIKETSTGTGLQHINRNFFNDYLIYLPPLNEQKRIVEKLDAILPKVKSAKARLEKIPAILKKFRQSVLAAACSGRLTEDWRENHSFKNSYTGELANEEPYELLDDWLWVELKNISNGFQYGTSSKSVDEGKVPVLRMGNLQNGKIDWSDLKFTNDDSEIEKYSLSYGDVLFNRTNSPDLVGKTAIFKEKRAAIFAGYLIRIKYKPEYINSDYLNYCLNTERAKEWCKQVKTDGVSQSNINAQVLSTFLIPLPPLEEQQEIVRRVEKLFALVDSLEAKYRKAMERVEKLEQAILAKAFRGELVEPDPNDEPAEELLKRILEEKAKLESGKKSRKPKARKK